MSTYHYVECGLPNVYIEGLPPVVDDDGDEVVEIPFIAALHAEIARGIVMHKGNMSGKELRFLRTEMGLTQAGLATVVGVAPLTLGRWERDENPMDQSAETLIRKLAIERLLKPFDTSVEELAQKVASDDPHNGPMTIRAEGERYTLDAA